MIEYVIGDITMPGVYVLSYTLIEVVSGMQDVERRIPNKQCYIDIKKTCTKHKVSFKGLPMAPQKGNMMHNEVFFSRCF